MCMKHPLSVTGRRVNWNWQPMNRFLPIPFIFAALAALFLCIALLDVGRHGLKIAIAGKTWLRIGLIFAAVSAYLFLTRRPFP